MVIAYLDLCHMAVRQKIVEYAVSHWKERFPILNSTCVEVQYKNVDDYKNYMSANGKQGTDYEIACFIKVYSVSVTVFEKVNDKIHSYNINDKKEPENIDLLFTDYNRNGHWQILKKISNISNCTFEAVNNSLNNEQLRIKKVSENNNIFIENNNHENIIETPIIKQVTNFKRNLSKIYNMEKNNFKLTHLWMENKNYNNKNYNELDNTLNIMSSDVNLNEDLGFSNKSYNTRPKREIFLSKIIKTRCLRKYEKTYRLVKVIVKMIVMMVLCLQCHNIEVNLF